MGQPSGQAQEEHRPGPAPSCLRCWSHPESPLTAQAGEALLTLSPNSGDPSARSGSGRGQLNHL